MIYVNIVNVLLALSTVVVSWQIYRITRAKSVLCIFMAMLLGTINRVLIIFNYPYTMVVSLIFWILWVVGLLVLLKVLKKYIK